MLNIHDLERRWLRYKIKSYLPLVGASVFVIAGVIALNLFLPFTPLKTEKAPLITRTPQNFEKEVLTIQKETVTSAIEVPENTDNHYNENTSVAYSVQLKPKETLVLKPSLHFMDNIEDGISPYIQDEYIKQTTSTPENTTLNTQESIEIPTLTNELVPKSKKSSLSITRHQEKDDLKDVIRRFKKNKNPALSLFIAKRYYADGKYQKSYNYALMTNEIDKNIEESWIIFAKSLVKLGQHELASNTLKSYLKTTKSSAADVLLRKIEGGTFR